MIIMVIINRHLYGFMIVFVYRILWFSIIMIVFVYFTSFKEKNDLPIF